MKIFAHILLALATIVVVQAQDCQLAVTAVDLPTGVEKHHFPRQEMPVASHTNHFFYKADWQEGDVVIRIRFSEDGSNWTPWQILKKDYMAAQNNTLVNMGDSNYRFFEWVAFNKGGAPTTLALQFYHPTATPLFTDLGQAYAYEVSTAACPALQMASLQQGSPLVSTQEEEK